MDSLIADISPVNELMNLAYANHEITDEYLTEVSTERTRFQFFCIVIVIDIDIGIVIVLFDINVACYRDMKQNAMDLNF